MSDMYKSEVALKIPGGFRFPNYRLASAWLALALLGGGFLLLRYKTIPGLVAGAVAVYALYAGFEFLRGVSVKAGFVSTPRPMTASIPVLPFGRMTIALTGLREVTALGVFLSFETVGLTSGEAQIPALFANRDKRLAFFEALKAHKPDIKIYRAF